MWCFYYITSNFNYMIFNDLHTDFYLNLGCNLIVNYDH